MNSIPANKRVLVIDDNPAIHGDFRKVLTDRGGASGLDAAEEALFGDTSASRPRRATFALTYAAQGKNDEALVAFSHAGGPAIGHANLGYILAAMGKPEQAREYYKKAVDLQPELNAARHALARLDQDTKVSDEATMVASATKPGTTAAPLPPVVPAAVNLTLAAPKPAPLAPIVAPAVPIELKEAAAAVAPVAMAGPVKNVVDSRMTRSSTSIAPAFQVSPVATDKANTSVAKKRAKTDFLPPLPPLPGTEE